MPIHNSDIKIFASQQITDERDAGGRVTGNEITTSIISFRTFPYTVGDMALSKAFIGISTDNSDTYPESRK